MSKFLKPHIQTPGLLEPKVGDPEETLHHRVQKAEHRLLPMVINNLFENIN
jgi:folate-dependent phosphoribosylglycinamide formyltransferase PurN